MVPLGDPTSVLYACYWKIFPQIFFFISFLIIIIIVNHFLTQKCKVRWTPSLALESGMAVRSGKAFFLNLPIFMVIAA